MFDIRRFLEFLRYSPAGRFLTFVAVVVILAISFKGCKQSVSAPRILFSESKIPRPIERSNSPLTLPRKEIPKPAPPKAPEPLPPIRIFSETNTLPAGDSAALPYGWLIPCRLVVTVDSSDKDTPIIALITEDISFDGTLVIPKNSVIHGRALANHTRDRIMSQNQWVLVFPSGHELRFSGLALDMDRVQEHWNLSDGSPGMKGFLVSPEKSEELKVVIAALLAGSIEPFKDRSANYLGPSVLPTARNAALGGVGTVFETYAQRLLQSIPADFVRVPAGKTFYLYPTERIELAHAKPLPHADENAPPFTSDP